AEKFLLEIRPIKFFTPYLKIGVDGINKTEFNKTILKTNFYKDRKIRRSIKRFIFLNKGEFITIYINNFDKRRKQK
ncbi:hypothetical protein CGH43_10805, partial [Vibrio parahaemolyticus]